MGSFFTGRKVNKLIARLRKGDASAGYELAMEIGWPAFGGLVDCLADPDEGIRGRAVSALILLGKDRPDDEFQRWVEGQHVAPWARCLTHSDPHVRRDAATGLAWMGSKASPALLELMKAAQDEDIAVRIVVAVAIGNIGEGAANAVPVLIHLLDDESEQVVREAAWALGRIGPSAAPEAVPPLTRLLDSADFVAAAKAAEALGELGAREARYVLERVAQSEFRELRDAATAALRKVGGIM